MTKIIFTGISAYAAGAWDKETKRNFFKCYPKDIKHPAIAMLYGPWGTKKMMGVAKGFTAKFSDRPHLIACHISAETARRTGRDGDQIENGLNTSDYNKALISKNAWTLGCVKRRVEEILNLYAAIANENTHLWLSTGLEHNLNVEAATVLARTVKRAVKEWPAEKGNLEKQICLYNKIRIINNPMTQQPKPRVKGVFTERHGRNIGGSEVHSFDGVHIGKIDSASIEDIGYENALKVIQKAKGNYKAIFLWSCLAQGWRNQPAQPYENRTYLISEQEIEGFKTILRGI